MKLSLRFLLSSLLVLVSLMLLSSCSSYKKVPYLQVKGDPDSILTVIPPSHRGTVRFRPEDKLNIVVYTPRETSGGSSFNLINATQRSSGTVSSYVVDSDGNIDFPILGLLHVEGLTREELEHELKYLLREYIKEEPIVTVALTNFAFYILGEVRSPGLQTVDKDRLNLLEALAMSGDLTQFGKRDRIMLVREEANGEILKVRLDISEASIMASPYFQLQQNDIIYVEHNRANTGFSMIRSQTSFWMSMLSVITTLAVLFISYK